MNKKTNIIYVPLTNINTMTKKQQMQKNVYVIHTSNAYKIPTNDITNN